MNTEKNKAEEWKVIGKFRGGGKWESAETFPTEEAAKIGQAELKRKEYTPNDWTRVVRVTQTREVLK